MTLSLVKILFASLVFISVAKAQSNGSQMYSQLQGTYWSGEFQVKIKTKKGKVLKALQKFPIEISFLKQQDETGIGYTFIKDVSKATKAEDRGFGDSIPDRGGIALVRMGPRRRPACLLRIAPQ